MDFGNMNKSYIDTLLFPDELPLPDSMSCVFSWGAIKEGNEQFHSVPKKDGFTANRFLGRYMGFGYALLKDRISGFFLLSSDVLKEHCTKNEWDAIQKFVFKFKTYPKPNRDVLRDSLRLLGEEEGVAIYFNKEDPDLLHEEVDIDLNKGIPHSIPSYMMDKLKEKLLYAIIIEHLSEEDAVRMLQQEDALDEKHAKRVLDSSRYDIHHVFSPNLPNLRFVSDDILYCDGGKDRRDWYVDVPEKNGFPSIRFWGRLKGFGYAFLSSKTDRDFSTINLDLLKEYCPQYVWDKIEILLDKIKTQEQTNGTSFDDEYMDYLGTLEGMFIYENGDDINLLYEEVNINLNQGKAGCLKSYMLGKLSERITPAMSTQEMSKDDVAKLLVKEEELSVLQAYNAISFTLYRNSLIENRIIEMEKKKKEWKEGVLVGTFFTILGLLLAITGSGFFYMFIAIGILFLGIMCLAAGIITYKEIKV